MLNGGAGAFGGAGFNDLTHQHEKGHHSRRLVFAGGERGQHGNGDQFVDAQDAAAEVLDGGQDDGVAQNDGANQTAGAGNRMPLREEPIHQKRVEYEDEPDQRLPEPHRGMLMVVAACRARFIVLVPAQERSDLHGINESNAGGGGPRHSWLGLLRFGFGNLAV